ncbi:hypothetical protein JKF63_02161 [Porcisia hertigi]|uniref:Uncharacterized protein n=1 Tax=Porcisia hertigi TaxID=2761500 RepID=A0A836I7P4_9TRYP|nr:hypothetical protein JKF63_02161 [Porcisia hertigi]
MSIIYVDELVIRLPSDARNTFNPLYAFGGGGGGSKNNNNRFSAPVMGLREVCSGHVLLPIDEEGSIVVTPGQRYSVVLVREMRRDSAASVVAPPPAGAGSLSSASNCLPSGGNRNANEKKKTGATPVGPQKQQPQPQQACLQQQQPTKQPSVVREVSVPAPVSQNAVSQPKKGHKASHQSTPPDTAPTSEALCVPTEAEPNPANRKRRRQDDNTVQAQQKQQRDRQTTSLTTNKNDVELDTDDVPLIDVYRNQESYTSPRTSPVIEPSMSTESSHHHRKRGSSRKKPETSLMPPPSPSPMRRSPSGDNGYGKQGSPSLVPLSSAQPAASHPPTLTQEPAVEEDVRTTATSKKRHSRSKVMAPTFASAAAAAAAPTNGPRNSPQQQPETSDEVKSATKAPRQRSASTENIPVTLPPSTRASTVRRVPLDTSSDSD